MYQIAVCDDSQQDSALLQNMLDDYEEALNEPMSVKSFPDAEALLGYISLNSYRPDLLLMDISLPGMSGLEAVRKLRTESFTGEVIFTTASPNYALAAYELDAKQYLMKPLNRQRFFAVLREIFQSGRKYLMVRQKRAVRKILLDDILYCETQGKHQVIHTSSEDVRVRITSGAMRRLVPPPRKFTALGAAYILNLDKISILSEDKVIFDGGKVLVLSHRRFCALLREVQWQKN